MKLSVILLPLLGFCTLAMIQTLLTSDDKHFFTHAIALQIEYQEHMDWYNDITSLYIAQIECLMNVLCDQLNQSSNINPSKESEPMALLAVLLEYEQAIEAMGESGASVSKVLKETKEASEDYHRAIGEFDAWVQDFKMQVKNAL